MATQGAHWSKAYEEFFAAWHQLRDRLTGKGEPTLNKNDFKTAVSNLLQTTARNVVLQEEKPKKILKKRYQLSPGESDSYNAMLGEIGTSISFKTFYEYINALMKEEGLELTDADTFIDQLVEGITGDKNLVNRYCQFLTKQKDLVEGALENLTDRFLKEQEIPEKSADRLLLTDAEGVNDCVKRLFYRWVLEQVRLGAPDAASSGELQQAVDEAVQQYTKFNKNILGDNGIRTEILQHVQGRRRGILLKTALSKAIKKQPDEVTARRTLQQVATLVVGSLEQERQPEESERPPKPEGEYYWMWWAFENTEQVEALNKAGNYPRNIGKLDKAKYQEHEQKEVVDLLANNKEHGTVAGQFLGMSGTAKMEQEFAARESDTNDWNKYPIVALGAALAHLKDRRKYANDQEAYKRRDPEDMRWKWIPYTNNKGEIVQFGDIKGRVVVWEEIEDILERYGIKCTYEQLVKLEVNLSEPLWGLLLTQEGLGLKEKELFVRPWRKDQRLEPLFQYKDDGYFTLAQVPTAPDIEVLYHANKKVGVNDAKSAPHILPIDGKNAEENKQTKTFRRFINVQSESKREGVLIVVKTGEKAVRKPELKRLIPVVNDKPEGGGRGKRHKDRLKPDYGPLNAKPKGDYELENDKFPKSIMVAAPDTNIQATFQVEKSGPTFKVRYACVAINPKGEVVSPELRELWVKNTKTGITTFRTLSQPQETTNEMSVTAEVSFPKDFRHDVCRIVCLAFHEDVKDINVSDEVLGEVAKGFHDDSDIKEASLWDANYLDIIVNHEVHALDEGTVEQIRHVREQLKKHFTFGKRLDEVTEEETLRWHEPGTEKVVEELLRYVAAIHETVAPRLEQLSENERKNYERTYTIVRRFLQKLDKAYKENRVNDDALLKAGSKKRLIGYIDQLLRFAESQVQQ